MVGWEVLKIMLVSMILSAVMTGIVGLLVAVNEFFLAAFLMLSFIGIVAMLPDPGRPRQQ
jgi:branched-subunit amino acid permease